MSNYLGISQRFESSCTNLVVPKPCCRASECARVTDYSEGILLSSCRLFGKFPARGLWQEEVTVNPVFQELRSRFWHTGGMYLNCDTFAERLRTAADYVAFAQRLTTEGGKENSVLVYGDRDG